MTLRTATPATIDGELSDLYQHSHTLEIHIRGAHWALDPQSIPERHRRYGWTGVAPTGAEAAKLREGLATDTATLEVVDGKIANREGEFERRGGWSRFWIVRNTGGHLHTSRDCNTCFRTTQFGWVTADSGKTNAEAVEVWGESVCTVCIPEAPTFPRFREPSRETQAAKAEAATEKAAKLDKRTAKAAATKLREIRSRLVEMLVLKREVAAWPYTDRGWDAAMIARRAATDAASIESIPAWVASVMQAEGMDAEAVMVRANKSARAKWSRDGYNKPPHIWAGQQDGAPQPSAIGAWEDQTA